MQAKMFAKSSIAFWVVISIQIYFSEFVFGSSGLYSDNGVDQTIREKNIHRSDIQRIRSHILDMVGLPKRPYDEHSHHRVNHNRSHAR